MLIAHVAAWCEVVIMIFLVHVHVQELGEGEYRRWKEERENAELSADQRDEKIFQSNCHVEQKLQLLGEHSLSLSLSLSLSPSPPLFPVCHFCYIMQN